VSPPEASPPEAFPGRVRWRADLLLLLPMLLDVVPFAIAESHLRMVDPVSLKLCGKNLPTGWCSSVCVFQFPFADRWRSLSWRAEHLPLFRPHRRRPSSAFTSAGMPLSTWFRARIVVVSWSFADRLHGVNPFMLKVPRLVQYVFFLISSSVPMWFPVWSCRAIQLALERIRSP